MPQSRTLGAAHAERVPPRLARGRHRPRHPPSPVALVVAALGILVTGSLLVLPAAVAGPVAPATTQEGVPQFSHVFLIVGENTGYHQVNKENAPYLIQTVEPHSAWMTDYFGVTHYSLSNYVAMTSGQFTPCEQEDGAPTQCHQNVNNLFHQLDANGTSWTSWVESMPSPCYLNNSGSDAGLNPYAPKHNPAIYYDDLEGPGGVFSANSTSAECRARDVPSGTTGPSNMSYFNAALAAGTVSAFNYIVPNVCQDAHDTCVQKVQRITQFDDFLAQEVPQILASPAWDSHSVLIITFDEGVLTGPHFANKHGNGGQVVCAIVSPMVTEGSYGGSYNHYSLLRTLEDGYGISTYLGNASAAPPIRSIWS